MNCIHKFKKHKALFSAYNTGLVAFFTIAVVLSIIIINVGFMVSDSQKKVVVKALDEVDEYLVVAGQFSALTDLSTNKIIISSTPVKTASSGSIFIEIENLTISYKIRQLQNRTVIIENVYVGNLNNETHNSVNSAVKSAYNQGLIDANPFEESIPSTQAFFYWIINENFDQKIDPNELAALAIVYGENEKPSSGELIQVNISNSEFNILVIDKEIPNISKRTITFGGMLKNP